MNNISFDTHEQLIKNLDVKIREVLTVENGNRTLEVESIDMPKFERKESLRKEKSAKISGLSYAKPVKATLVLKEGGKIVNKGKVKVLDLPEVTLRGSYIVGGNEYTFPLQKRIIPGVYTEKKGDEEVSAWINSSKGVNMKLKLREGGDFVLEVRGVMINLHAFLIGMGVSATQLSRAWGKEVFDTNRSARGGQNFLKALDKFYKKVKYPTDDGVKSKDIAGYREWIQKYFDEKSEFEGDNVKICLGKKYDKISTGFLVHVSQNVLSVSRGEKDEDDRDSLIHNQILDLSDFIIERLSQSQYRYRIQRTLKRNIKRYDKVSEIYQKDLLQKPIESTFTQTNLSRIPKQTNPMDIMSSYSEISVMGEGGIGDVHAVTNDTRAINPSHFGFIDPAHTPEGINIGTTTHVTHGVKKKGKTLVNSFYNVKTNKPEELNPRQVHNSYVVFSESYKGGKIVKEDDGLVRAMHGGEMVKVKPSKIQYAMRASTDLFDVNTMAIPFLSHNNGTRVMTAAKMQTQAKPLKNREVPLIQCAESEKSNVTIEESMGKNFGDRSPVSGVIDKVGKNTIVIKDSKGEKHTIEIADDFWMNSNNYMDSTPVVKKGDKVKKGDLLTETNYSKDGKLALGTNLRTAYIAYKGLNHEDSTVISESCAEKLTSLHAYQKVCPIQDNETLDKKKFLSYFPATFNREQIAKIGDEGVIKKGQKVQKGDPIVLKMKKVEEETLSRKLQNISRLLTQDFKDTTMTWEKSTSGVVAEVHHRRNDILVVIKTEERAKIGDKLVARYGNKCTITDILPDDEMPKDEDGNSMDILLNPDGVPGRMNIGQVLETTASNIAEKTGKPYIAKPFEGDHARKLEKELKQHGLKDHGTITDKDGSIDGVLTGKQYFLKLEHQVEKKLSARGAGAEYSYTLDGHPARGGGQSGRASGLSEMYALLAHGADANLKEMYTFKGDKQFEIWRAIENGTFVPPPDMPLSSQKFVNMLRGMGVDLQESSGEVKMVPFLDRDVKKISNGEIKDATALRAKDLKEEDGGLFDFKTTGGLIGEKWAHINLSEPMPHPTFEKAILDVTHLTKKDFNSIMSGKKGVVQGKVVKADTTGAVSGGKAIKQLLNVIDPESRIEEIKKIAPKKKGSELNKLHREARTLRNFNDNGIKLEEMVIEKVPVIPPKFRPIVELPTGDISVSDVNEHYRATILMNQQLEKFKGRPALEEEASGIRSQMYESMKGTMGFSAGLIDKPNVKGLASTIAGGSPKTGYFQSKTLKRRQDGSGTAVIGPDPKLDMDQMGIPENMAWEIFKPYLIKELKARGFTSIKAREQIEKRSKIAKDALLKVMDERMVIANRAPTLHKFSMLAFKPKLVPGYQVKVPIEVLGAYNADFDGDTFGIYVPATREATEEARGMVASKNVHMPGSRRGKMAPGLQKEYMLGVYKISRVIKKKNNKYKDVKEAIKAAENKEIEWTDLVTIEGVGRTTAGRALLNTFVPKDFREYDVEFTDKKIQGKLNEVYKKHGREKYLKMINGWKHAGRKHVYTSGTSFLLSDLRAFTKEKDKLYADADKKAKKIRANKSTSKEHKDEELIKIYSEVDAKVVSRSMDLEDNDAGKSNNLSNMVASGMSKPGPSQMKQLVGSVGLMMDHRQKVIPEPVRGNYTEGLTSADFFAHMYSQRKGMIDKSRAVSGPGMLSKELTNTASRYKITEVDCGTTSGKMEDVNKNIIDRVLAKSVGKIPAGSVIDNDVLEKLKKTKRKQVEVRSVLKCNSGVGICAKCFGVDEQGGLPHVGKNIGISEIQSITERSVQLPMKAFHTGGVASGDTGLTNAFDRALEIFRMTENVKNKAILARKSGVIQSIRKSGYGGYVITIAGTEHKTPQARKLKVKTGDKVKKGDALTDGSIKPQELMKYKGVDAVQDQMTEDLHDAFAAAGVKVQKKSYEIPVKMYTEQVRVSNPGDSDFMPGDYSTISKVDFWNRSNVGKSQITYNNILSGSMQAPQKTDDWAQRMALGRIQQTLQEGASMGLASKRGGPGSTPFADISLGPGTKIKKPGQR